VSGVIRRIRLPRLSWLLYVIKMGISNPRLRITTHETHVWFDLINSACANEEGEERPETQRVESSDRKSQGNNELVPCSSSHVDSDSASLSVHHYVMA
jgi:hypothetical protein